MTPTQLPVSPSYQYHIRPQYLYILQHLHHHSRPLQPTDQNAEENAGQEAFPIGVLVIIRGERDEGGAEAKEIFNIQQPQDNAEWVSEG